MSNGIVSKIQKHAKYTEVHSLIAFKINWRQQNAYTQRSGKVDSSLGENHQNKESFKHGSRQRSTMTLFECDRCIFMVIKMTNSRPGNVDDWY